MIHYFHFRLDWKTILQLMKAGNLEDWRDLSPFIVKIMEKACWFIEEHHFTGSEMGSRYKLISDDLKDERLELWLPLPEEIYRRLKQLHHDLNYFSIAQLVRLVIAFFLELRKNRSLEEVYALLQARAEAWPEKLKRFRIDKKIQLSPRRAYEPLYEGKLSPYLVIYNRQARPVNKFAY